MEQTCADLQDHRHLLQHELPQLSFPLHAHVFPWRSELLGGHHERGDADGAHVAVRPGAAGQVQQVVEEVRVEHRPVGPADVHDDLDQFIHDERRESLRMCEGDKS